MKLIKIISLTLLISIDAYSAQSLSTKITHQYDSMRALGMGNAFTAVADDYSLIYYNPAGFAKKKENEIQFSLVGAGYSAKTKSLMDDIKTASDTTGTDEQKANAISNVLEQYYGKSLGGKIQAVELFWVRKNWGVSLLPVDLTIDMTINRQLGPAIDLNVKGDSVLAYGYGTDFGTANSAFTAGVTAKFVHRVAVEQSVSALELASDSDVMSSKRFKEGQMVDFDLGVMWSPSWFGHTVVKEEKPDGLKVESKLETKEEPKKEEVKAEEKREPQSVAKKQPASLDEKDLAQVPAPAADEKAAATADTKTDKKSDETKTETKTEETKKPTESVVKETYKDNLPLTLGLVMHNVLGGNFTQSKMVNKDATEVPTRQYFVTDLGSQYVLSEYGSLTIRSMLDFRDIFHPEITFNKAFHAGLEFDYSPSGWFKSQVRGGINQMYYTAGVTLLLGIINIDVVTYGEEVGTVSNKIENRVYAAKVGMNF